MTFRRLLEVLAAQPRWLTATAIVLLLYLGSTLIVRRAGELEDEPPRVELSARTAQPPGPRTGGELPAGPGASGEQLLLAADLPVFAPEYRPGEPAGLESPRFETNLRRGQPDPLPALRALAPRQLGATASASPTLYFHLSGPSPLRVEFSLTAEDSIDPVLELALEPPVAGGLHAVALADHAVALVPGVPYRWYTSLVVDPARRELDRVASAALRFVPPGPDAARRLATVSTAERAHAEAALGYWYDAFATLSAWKQSHPRLERLDAHRVALLEQVGLDDVASRLGPPRGGE